MFHAIIFFVLLDLAFAQDSIVVPGQQLGHDDDSKEPEESDVGLGHSSTNVSVNVTIHTIPVSTISQPTSQTPC